MKLLLFSVATLTAIALMVIPNASASEITMDFDLYPQEQLGGLSVLHFGAELTSFEPTTLFQAAPKDTPVVVRSAKIRKAEAGTVIGLYHKSTDEEPSVSISFPVVDIHEEVDLDHLTGKYVKNNVHVWVKSPEAAEYEFEKVDITRTKPQFFVL